MEAANGIGKSIHPAMLEVLSKAGRFTGKVAPPARWAAAAAPTGAQY